MKTSFKQDYTTLILIIIAGLNLWLDKAVGRSNLPSFLYILINEATFLAIYLNYLLDLCISPIFISKIKNLSVSNVVIRVFVETTKR